MVLLSMKRQHNLLKRILTFSPIVIVLFVVALILTGNYICPLYYYFDIPCLGCGMTRAYRALLRLDLKTAFEYHCLFPIPMIWAIYQIVGKYIRQGRLVEYIFFCASVLLFIIRWIAILFMDNHIIYT